MIDARELRIGNYFEWSPLASMGKGLDKITHGQQIMDYLQFKDPIQLTEEWLLKFGFYEIEESEFYDKEIDGERYISINIKPKKCFVGASVDWTSIKFPESVHQLQNLYFALTGEELTIKL